MKLNMNENGNNETDNTNSQMMSLGVTPPLHDSSIHNTESDSPEKQIAKLDTTKDINLTQ